MLIENSDKYDKVHATNSSIFMLQLMKFQNLRHFEFEIDFLKYSKLKKKNKLKT